jgi:Holliday junction DNA helicase RuvA
MYEFIKGKITEVTPAYVIIENGGIGYFINISLNTYSQISEKSEISIYLEEIIREDAFSLYGFSTTSEREIFRHLLSVSGVGANTARVILSSMSPQEIKNAILNEQVNSLKKVKGIGAKSAQRIIVDLKDKLSKTETEEEFVTPANNTIKEEALSALVTLGFTKSKVEKVLDELIQKEGEIQVEQIIKKALSQL